MSTNCDQIPCRSVAIPTVLLILVLASPASAQIGAPVDLGSSTADHAATTSLTVTTSAPAAAGGSILVIASSEGAVGEQPTSAACSDSANHTYHTDVSQSSIQVFTIICSTHGIAASLPTGSTVKVAWSGGSLGGGAGWNQRVHAFSVTGLSSAPFDQTASANGISLSPTSGPVATTQASELLFSAVSDDGETVAFAGFNPGANGTPNTCATSVTPFYSSLGGVSTANFAPSLFGMYCVVSSTGTYAASATVSFPVNASWTALLATYKATGPVTPVSPVSTPTLSQLGMLLFAALLPAAAALQLRAKTRTR